jgi:hypothetical protein
MLETRRPSFRLPPRKRVKLQSVLEEPRLIRVHG